jgi:alpha-beta hydrolase superfamily lysophospholipase
VTMRGATVELDVQGVAPNGAVTVALDVFAPDDDATLRVPPVVLFCFPGGGISRGYWHIETASPERLGNYSFAEHMTAWGYVVVTVDHLGVGESGRVDDPADYTSEAVADVDAYAVQRITARLGDGTAVDGLRPIQQPRRVAVGHSMGAIFSIWQQARHDAFDALVLLGWGASGLRIDELAEFTARSKENRRGWNTDDAAPGGTATSDLLLAGMPVPLELYPVLEATGTDFVPLDGMERLHRGSDILASVTVPTFVGVGDRDIMAGDPREIPTALPACNDITLFVLPDAGHNHNVAPNRDELWDHVARWIEARGW